jgi:energy-coupling factor transporter ATP-binding protein EcfA2
VAIYFKTPPEPLAGPPGDEARTNPQPLVLAESQASKRLETVVERYCNREIAGRSVLIAGHRGAGKTTLAKAVIQTLRRRADLGKSAIPLYVQIHGPDLLGGETVLGRETTGSFGDTLPSKQPEPSLPNSATPGANRTSFTSDHAKQQDQDEITQALTSLRVLTVALHRAFVTDLGWAFERSVSPQHVSQDERSHLARFQDLQEVAAQLRLDFDNLVETDGLRWMWSRAGLLHRGTLRRYTGADEVATDYFSKQGLLELVAATCVSDSFIRGVAKVDDLDSTKAEAEFKQTYEVEKMQERKELVNAVAGILAGGIAGTGIALNGSHSTTNGIISGVVFVLAAIFTTKLLNYTSVRTRSTKSSRERSIRWDRSVASLDLMLPLAIARILDAGRAPIFVIDELDKVNEIEDKLERLINRLKHIVADRALFCFLVDRPYFERIQNISRTQPQRKEHTFFSERLYVIATPAQWRTYLQSVLTLDTPSGLEKLQLLALTYLLMARSKMHAIDIRREIDALPHDPATPSRLDLPDLLGPPLYRNMIYMQAVVEYVLEDDKLKSRLQRDPTFVQYMYDALYYLLRQWEQDKAPTVSRESVRAYLESRASKENSEMLKQA